MCKKSTTLFIMKYTLVTGFYPSEETAKKILTKVKGNGINAFIRQYEDCYIVVLYESNDYEKIDSVFSECMKKKIYCGIITNGKD